MEKIIGTEKDVQTILERLAQEVMECNAASQQLVILGIQRRGVHIADRLRQLLERQLGRILPFGKLDINFYRDDWTSMASTPVIGNTYIPFSLEGCTVVLVDDVLFTGRTIRAALEAIIDHGRPQRVELLVLIDRGHRELPIQADFVGKFIATEPNEQIDVFLKESDGRDEVVLKIRDR